MNENKLQVPIDTSDPPTLTAVISLPDYYIDIMSRMVRLCATLGPRVQNIASCGCDKDIDFSKTIPVCSVCDLPVHQFVEIKDMSVLYEEQRRIKGNV